LSASRDVFRNMPNQILGPDGRPIRSSRDRKIKPALLSFLAAVGALAALIANFNNIYKTISGWFPKRIDPHIEYARFYGTFAVPYLLTSRKPNEGDELFNRIFLVDFKETTEWWDKSKFRHMNIGISPPLQQVSTAMGRFKVNPKDINNPLYSLLFAADGNSKDCYVYLDPWTFELSPKKISSIEAMLDSKGVEPDRGRRVKYCEQLLTTSSNKTGYLFLQIRNPNDKPLTDVVINYNFWIMSNLGQEQWQTDDRITPSNANKPVLKDITIPRLEAGAEHLILLSVFLASSDQFPEKFTSSIILPIKYSWKVDGKEFSSKIRQPLLENAARVIVPIGWYQQ
jgi:hypothetical protein